MKAEFTLFQNTGSDPSAAGVAKSSGRIPCAGCRGCSGEPGVTEEWNTWITSSGVLEAERAVRNAVSRAWMLTLYTGLERVVPQVDTVSGWQKPDWLSIRRRAVGRLRSRGDILNV